MCFVHRFYLFKECFEPKLEYFSCDCNIFSYPIWQIMLKGYLGNGVSIRNVTREGER